MQVPTIDVYFPSGLAFEVLGFASVGVVDVVCGVSLCGCSCVSSVFVLFLLAGRPVRRGQARWMKRKSRAEVLSNAVCVEHVCEGRDGGSGDLFVLAGQNTAFLPVGKYSYSCTICLVRISR